MIRKIRFVYLYANWIFIVFIAIYIQPIIDSFVMLLVFALFSRSKEEK